MSSPWNNVDSTTYSRDLGADGHVVVTMDHRWVKWRWDHYNVNGWVAHSVVHNTAMDAMGDFDGWWPTDDASKTREP